MNPLIRPDAHEPVLILTDEDFRRAFSTPPPPAAQAATSPPARRGAGRVVAWGLILAAASGGAAAWLMREKTRPVLPLVAAAPASRPLPLSPPVSEPAPPAPRPRAAPVPAPVLPEEEPPLVAVRPAPKPPPPPPWQGGRAWALLRLRMEHRSNVQESERRVILVGDGSRFVVERSDGGPPDVWLDRLELLLQLPAEDDSWRRQVTQTGEETLHLEKGDLACRVVEGEDRFPQGVRRFRYWYSDEFPAGAVRAEQSLGDTVFACRVLDYGRAPSRKP